MQLRISYNRNAAWLRRQARRPLSGPYAQRGRCLRSALFVFYRYRYISFASSFRTVSAISVTSTFTDRVPN